MHKVNYLKLKGEELQKMKIDFKKEYGRKSAEFNYIQTLAKDYEASKDENREEPYITMRISDRRNFIYNYGVDAFALYETLLSFMKGEFWKEGNPSVVIPRKYIWLELNWDNRKYEAALKTLIDYNIVEVEKETKGVKFTLIKDYRANGDKKKIYLHDLYRNSSRYIEKDEVLMSEIKKKADLNSKLRESNISLQEESKQETTKLGLEQIELKQNYKIKPFSIEDIQDESPVLASCLKQLNLSAPICSEILNSTPRDMGNYLIRETKRNFSQQEINEIMEFLNKREKENFKIKFFKTQIK